MTQGFQIWNEDLPLAEPFIYDKLFLALFGKDWNARIDKHGNNFKNPNVQQAMYDLDVTVKHDVVTIFYKEKFVFCELDDRFPSPENVAKLRLLML